ncbi:unnamed protein product [Psylliodes chrysocephalus]|uniref:Sodium-independent sulfate anion transporter n=1 Tax=Psylliodes chrysocephalus TaxID=3402493 RepID=A0A9P0DB82_9CUCU|nr:unnamed protein product [Psylliodes chrysocephala]
MGRKTDPQTTLIAKVKAQLFQRLVILQWLPKYTKSDILADLIAGLTLGLTMMPQSIAYAGLAGLEPQYGLYTAFIGSYTYIFVGSIKEVSIGPTSLMSLLTFSYTVGKPLECVILLTLIAGCVELLMGLLKLGFLVDFMSPCLTSGFTSASTLIIISAQLKNLFGLNIKSHAVIGIIKELIQKYDQIKLADTLLGLICIGLLVALKNLNRLKLTNPTLKKIIWLVSISKNALVVLLASVAAALWTSDGTTPFKITGDVPKGIPQFKFPSLSAQFGNETVGYAEMMGSLGSGLVVIPLVAVLTNVAIAKCYSSDVIVDNSQEMISLGLCNIFGSFVRAMPSSGAFTRSAVASSSDVRTPLQGLYSGTVIVLALSFLAPYFYFIPKAALAAVLITAVSSLFDYKIFPVLWRCNKVDFYLTLATFVIGTLMGVEAAILIGSICNLLVLLMIWARPKVQTEIRKKIDTEERYLYIKPELGLYYPGADYVSECIKKSSNENPSLPIVLDCINILRLDYAAAKTLENALNTYNDGGIGLVMINMETNVFNTLKSITDAENMQLCSNSDKITEIIVVDEKLGKEEEESLLNGKKEDRKSSTISKLSMASGRRRSSERKKSIFELE